MRALALAALAMGGCGSTGLDPSKAAVDVTVVADPSLTDPQVASIKKLVEDVSGAETFSATYTISDQLAGRTARFVYRPGVNAGTLIFTVTATDGAGGFVAAGSSTAVTLQAGSFSTATVTLRGGAPPDGGGGDMKCVFQSAEDCWNGVDDDCNGMTDCADPACQATAVCVPDKNGAFALGTELPAGGMCPAGYGGTSTDINTGLNVNAGCSSAGCTCSATVGCLVDVYVYNSQAACTADINLTGGTFAVSFTNSGPECTAHAFAVGNTLRSHSTTTSNPCVPGGAPALVPPAWTMSNRFCAADAIGKGCQPGYVCVRKAATPSCVLSPGAAACPAQYTAVGSSWYTGFTDGRMCGACACGAQTAGDCTKDVNGNPLYTDIYFGGCGSGINSSVPPNNQQCANPLNNADGAAGYQNGIQPKPPSCPPTSMVSGMLSATGEQTLCCM
jgi:hypothetical protein